MQIRTLSIKNNFQYWERYLGDWGFSPIIFCYFHHCHAYSNTG
ncbi:hypothetical protein TRICHSKD4_5788 [Roseibium sp. TrichSKD4]|nr:hypothetical protein TRICHSKD4_5788 [Roseibium sp. TrichSKD4]